VSAAVIGYRSEWSEWTLAFVVSALVNVLLVPLVVGVLTAIQLSRPAAEPVSEHEPVALIHPDMLQPEPEPVAEEKPQRRPFAHTSEEQEKGETERARYVGERDTLAAADKAPAEDTQLVPPQEGREPRAEGEMETVSRDYQDGTLEHQNDGAPGETASPAMPAEPAESVKAEPSVEEVPEYVQEAPTRERLADGPNPVERALPPEAAKEGDQVKEGGEPIQPKEVAEAAPKQTVPGGGEPGFRGNQIKTRLRGSISRRGTSSVDVENSATGRYQAVLNRAVEREWQRNCVRYRDFITPGFLTVRFMVQADGGVRSVQFVEVVEAGEIQKGFTLNSIRGAPIPPMPAKLKRDLKGEPLELIYNFYF
jgi:hypothetical protein